MCGPLLWGFWWILPLIGFVMCLAFMVFRVPGPGHGFMCMGGDRGTPNDRVAEPHR